VFPSPPQQRSTTSHSFCSQNMSYRNSVVRRPLSATVASLSPESQWVLGGHGCGGGGGEGWQPAGPARRCCMLRSRSWLDVRQPGGMQSDWNGSQASVDDCVCVWPHAQLAFTLPPPPPNDARVATELTRLAADARVAVVEAPRLACVETLGCDSTPKVDIVLLQFCSVEFGSEI